MKKELLINVSEGEECRIALIEDGRLEELYMERASATSHVGNIYKGKVTNVEPSIQAAFVDFGLGRNGFLHISDLMPTYFGRKGEGVLETVGRKMARRDRPPIQQCLRRGDEIIVQIIKEGIGTKGPTLSTYLSIPGRVLVMMPGMGKMGVSKKIEDDAERKRLRTILDGLEPPEGVGFIIRTAGIGKTKAEIERDLKYLTRLWEQLNEKQKQPGPQELYAEGDLVTRTVRDVWSPDIDRIVVDHKEVAKRIKEFFKLAMPRTKSKVEHYDEPIPLFHKYKIEREIEQIYSRHVPLPSGGSLVIDSTEAVVAIDVNSGKFRDHKDAETTAFRTDLEAADEIPRQLRLRDLGGVIICDFIDLRFERHRRELEQRLHQNLKNDRAKTKVLRMSQFGIIEMTRQRMRPSLKRSIYSDCPHCLGSGLVKTPESMSLDVMRRLAIAAHNDRVARIELTVNSDVASYLLNRKRAALSELEQESGKRILVLSDPRAGGDEVRFALFDQREGTVVLAELGMVPGQQQRDDRRRGHQQPTQPRRDGRGGPPQPARTELEFDLADELESEDGDNADARERDRAEQAIKPQMEQPPQQRPQQQPSRQRPPQDQQGGQRGGQPQQRSGGDRQNQPQRPQQGPPQQQGAPQQPPVKAPQSRDDDFEGDFEDEPQPNVAPDGTPLDENGNPIRQPKERDGRGRRGRRRGRGGSGGGGGGGQQPQGQRPQQPQHNQQRNNRGPNPQPPRQAHQQGPQQRPPQQRPPQQRYDRPMEAGGEDFDVFEDEETNSMPISAEGAPGQNGQPGDHGQTGENGQGGGRRRRRRRRGGRGRRRRNAEQQAMLANGTTAPEELGNDESLEPIDEVELVDEQPLDFDDASVDPVDDLDEPAPAPEPIEDEPAPLKVTEASDDSESPGETDDADEPAVVDEKPAKKPRTRAATRKKTATRRKSPKASTKSTKIAPVAVPQVESTGSTDKHQLDADVSVAPPDVEQLLSRFDLDAIPDDFDD